MLIQKEYIEMRNQSFAKSIIHPLLTGNEFLGHPLEIKKAKNEDISTLAKFAFENDWKPNIDIRKVLRPLTAVIVTDKEQTIQWVSSYFSRMTGYQTEEAIGKKPRFLQGPETSLADKANIRSHISSLKKFNGELVNYRKDGEPYLCKVEILPVFDQKGQHVNFIAFETDKI